MRTPLGDGQAAGIASGNPHVVGFEIQGHRLFPVPKRKHILVICCGQEKEHFESWKKPKSKGGIGTSVAPKRKRGIGASEVPERSTESEDVKQETVTYKVTKSSLLDN